MSSVSQPCLFWFSSGACADDSGFGLKIVEKLHLMKRKESRLKKLEASMEVYQNTAVYLGTHKMVLVNVLAITFAQRFALFAATWFVYRAFHLSGISFITIVLLQAVISVSVDMLPLPGGMGISETLFLKISRRSLEARCFFRQWCFPEGSATTGSCW